MSSLPAQPNQSLLEGLEVLLAVAQSGEPVGVRALGRELGLSPSRVQRYLATLAHLELTDRKPDRRYGTGPGIHALSAISLSASGLAARALTLLPDLAENDRIIALGVLWRSTVNYLYFNTPGHSVSQSLGKANGYPARESSIGLLMLATREESSIRDYFADEAEEILPLLTPIREKGYAVIHRDTGETSLAVPVGDPPVAGLASSGFFTAKEQQSLLTRLQEAADQISEPSPIQTNQTQPIPL